MTEHIAFDPPRAGRREWAALAVLVMVVTLLVIDGTVLYLAVPSLTADLAPSPVQLLWIGDIYAFILAGLLITMGNLADRIGRKRLLMIGAAGFGLASILAAFAPNAETLIVARALLGIAGATVMPSTLSIVRSMFADAKQRTRAIAVWSMGATAGGAVGPLVGGALLEHFWWGSVFLINVPVMVIVLVAGPILIPESRGEGLEPIDLMSSFLSILSIVPLVYAIKHWISGGFDWFVPAAALAGLAAGTIFLRRQLRIAHPLLDVTLFRMPAFAGAVAANTLAMFAFLGQLFFFSQYLQLVRGYGPLQAGLAELPATIASMVVITFVGTLVGRFGSGRAIGIGMAAAAAGLSMLGFTVFSTDYWGIGVALVLLGLGTGVSIALTIDAVVSSVPKSRSAAASSISETALELGGALGIAVLGSIQVAMYRSHLDLPSGTATVDAAVASDSLANTLTTVTDAEVLEHAKSAFTSAVQTTSLVAAAITLLAALVAWFVIPSPRDVTMEDVVDH